MNALMDKGADVFMLQAHGNSPSVLQMVACTVNPYHIYSELPNALATFPLLAVIRRLYCLLHAGDDQNPCCA
jgi:hypothetical protein